MSKSLLAAAAVAAMALPAQAVTVVQWDFENPPADLADSAASPTVAASTGTGTASGLHASAATDWTTPAGNGSANSLSSNNWAIGDYYQFSFSTAGYADLMLSFDQTSSSTGPRDFKLAYSTDGTAFTDAATYTVLLNGSPSWNSTTYAPQYTMSFDLSAVTALDNQGTVVLRLVDISSVSAGGGTVASGGTDRVDNFTVTMAPVPEAETASMLAAGLALLGFLGRRRRA